MLTNQWVRHFDVTDDDVDYLVNYLLENETPMTSTQLALTLIEKRLQDEQSEFENQYKDSAVYDPSKAYQVGDRLVFTALDFATANVTTIREGNNPAQYGEFSVITVEFDNDQLNTTPSREFVTEFKQEHPLANIADDESSMVTEQLSATEIFRSNHRAIMRSLIEKLSGTDALVRIGVEWFLSDLVIETDVGVLHLAEAVLDMAGGGPLLPEDILEQIGGIGADSSPIPLQAFSLNLAMSNDKRFDEVGPTGQINWYLNRMEPDYVRQIPDLLNYKDIDYDDDLLTEEMIDLETELDDELSPIDFEGELKSATTTLIYAHRRAGTLPLNAKMRKIFPYAKTPRIFVELKDETDGEIFRGWVVHDFGYVYGLLDYYSKHHLPIGVMITAKKGDKPGQIILSHEGYKPRTEWIRLVIPQNKRLTFENKKRAIGAEFDDLIIIGIDDLKAVDELVDSVSNNSLSGLLKMIIGELAKLSPQGTVHAATIYSSVNIFRRCPPGPIFATLNANPDFESAGDHYWKLT